MQHFVLKNNSVVGLVLITLTLVILARVVNCWALAIKASTEAQQKPQMFSEAPSESWSMPSSAPRHTELVQDDPAVNDDCLQT